MITFLAGLVVGAVLVLGVYFVGVWYIARHPPLG